MSISSTLGLPWGLRYAGGQGVIQGVEAGEYISNASASEGFLANIHRSANEPVCCLPDECKCVWTWLKHEPVLCNRCMSAAGNANGIARLTAIIVNLGLEKLAAGIVINLTDQGKADVVAQVGSLAWGLSHTMGGLPPR